MANPTTTQYIFKTILGSTYIFQDNSGKAFAKIAVGSRTDCVEVDGQRFEDFLTNLYFNTNGDVPSQNALKGLTRLVAAQARQKSHEDTWLRFGAANGVHILDLANPSGMVVDITVAGWTYSTAPMVNFLRPPSLLEIPTPASSGDYARITNYLNLDEDGKLLLLPSMPVMVMADIERPLVLLVGDARKGKSTIARLYRTLLDPADPWANKSPRKADEQALMMSSNAIPVLDNISEIPPWLADMYCEAFTGGGFQKRTLYTNAGSHLMSYRRGMVITSLALPTTRTDFLDRCMVVNMDGVQKIEKSAGIDLEKGFEKDRPSILGGMLDMLVAAKKLAPTLNFPNLPRYSDFARYGAAMAEVMGYGANRYVDALLGTIQSSAQEAIEVSDPVASALVNLAKSVGKFYGGSDDLLAALDGYRPRRLPDGTKWPENAIQLGKTLPKVKEYLDSHGVHLEVRPTNKGKRFTLECAPVAVEVEDKSASVAQHDLIDPITGEVVPAVYVDLDTVPGFPPVDGFDPCPVVMDPPMIDDFGYLYTPEEPPLPARRLTPEDDAGMCYLCTNGGVKARVCLKTQKAIDDLYSFRICPFYEDHAKRKISALEQKVQELEAAMPVPSPEPEQDAESTAEEDERERAEREEREREWDESGPDF